MARPYTARDVAGMLGITVDTFYRSREQRHDLDKLPRPLSERGRLKWDRSTIDAWLTRNHPWRPQAPANDIASLPDPASDEECRQRLAAAYGRY
jgi:predicted DNA-binding transcriptional regulator AlpA